MKYSYLLIFIFLNIGSIIGQDDCGALEKKFRAAERLFMDGNLYKAIDLLEDELKEEENLKGCDGTKLNVHLLLTKLYLLVKDDEQAEENYKTVLKNDPQFSPKENLEPIDLIYFADKYKAIPLYSITPELYIIQTGEKYFRNSRVVRSVEAVGTDPTDFIKGLTIDYKAQLSLGAGIRGSFFLTKNWEFSGACGINENRFSIIHEYSRNDASAFNELLSISETQLWTNFSGMVKYNFYKKSLGFNAFIGLEKNFLLNSHFTNATRGDFDLITAINDKIKREENEAIREELKKEYLGRDENSLKTKSLRSTGNHAIFYGLGLKYRPNKALNRNFIDLSIKFATFQKPINHGKNNKPVFVEENDIRRELVFGLNYIDDVIELSYFQISLGYSYTFYQVVEKDQKFKF